MNKYTIRQLILVVLALAESFSIGHQSDQLRQRDELIEQQAEYIETLEARDMTVELIYEAAEEAESEPEAEPEKPAWHDAGEFRIYHYCPCVKCCSKDDGITATGTMATEGRTIAVDPSVIPLGSEVEINGVIYVAEDTGVKGKTIDLFVSDHQKALQMGTYITCVKWRECP